MFYDTVVTEALFLKNTNRMKMIPIRNGNVTLLCSKWENKLTQHKCTGVTRGVSQTNKKVHAAEEGPGWRKDQEDAGDHTDSRPDKKHDFPPEPETTESISIKHMLCYINITASVLLYCGVGDVGWSLGGQRDPGQVNNPLQDMHHSLTHSHA